MTYDCFTFFNELDLLEIRLNILDPYVDYFVLAESLQTFSGKSKPLYYEENKERFKKWQDKIIVINPIPKEFTSPFERAGYQKDCIRSALRECNPDDLILYGDADEIASESAIKSGKEGKCRQLNYSYYLNNRSSEVWEGTNIIRYNNIYDLNKLRENHDVIIENGGYHFQNMFDHDKLINKLESYDHQECNIPWVKDGLQARMEANVDYLGRTHDWQGKPFKLWIDEKDLPKYILKNKELWKEKHLWK